MKEHSAKEHTAQMGLFIALGIGVGAAFGNFGIGLGVGIIVWGLVGLFKQHRQQAAENAPEEKL
jgi:hypothetical protein